MSKILNEEIDHKVIAAHFEDKFSNRRSAVVAMYQLKDKWLKERKGLWIIYVKAYNYDKLVEYAKDGYDE